MPKSKEAEELKLTFLVAVLYIITADKGGTGKSFTARVILDGLGEAGIPYTHMECDIGIPDTAKLFGDAKGYDIDTTEGWRKLYEDLVQAPKDRPVIVTMPGGALHRAETHLPAFLRILPLLSEHLDRPVRTIWAADDKRDVIESMRAFRLATDNKLVIDIVKNEQFCPADQFKLFDNSEERKILEANGGQIVVLPKVAYRISQVFTNKRLKGDEVVSRLDLLDRIEYEMWWASVRANFRAAGLIP